MRASRFQLESEFDAPVEALWQAHMRPDALARLTPPLTGFVVTDPGEGVADGSVVEARVGPGMRWRALHTGVRPHQGFTDVALESPFRYWVHQHLFERLGEGRSRLRDVVFFVPPRWIPARPARWAFATLLGLLFRWRHRATRRLVADVEAGGGGGTRLQLSSCRVI